MRNPLQTAAQICGIDGPENKRILSNHFWFYCFEAELKDEIEEGPMVEGASAWRLIISGDPTLYAIAFLSLKVSLSAVALAALFGFPLGALIAFTSFPGRSALVVLINAFMGLPPVVRSEEAHV